MGYRISSWILRGLASDSFVIIRDTITSLSGRNRSTPSMDQCEDRWVFRLKISCKCSRVEGAWGTLPKGGWAVSPLDHKLASKRYMDAYDTCIYSSLILIIIHMRIWKYDMISQSDTHNHHLRTKKWFVGSRFRMSVLGREALKPARYEERKLCSSRLNGPHHALIINTEMHIMPWIRTTNTYTDSLTYIIHLISILLALGVTELSPHTQSLRAKMGW